MVTKNIVKLPKAMVEVQISLPWPDMESRWNEVLNKLASDVEIPGFRKGQAPMDMIEPKIAQQAQQELLRVSMPQALIEALQGTNIVPIDYPRYEVQSFQKGVGVTFKALVTERPQVKVGSYKTIKVTRPPLKQITDSDIDKVVEDLYRRWKVRNPSTGSASSLQAGSGPVGPQAQASTQSSGASGSLQFGKTDTPPTTTSNVPDDIFAKGVGATDLADLKKKIRGDLEAEAKYNNELDYEEAILQSVEKMTEVDIPDILIEDELNRMLVSLQRNVTDRGMLLDEYLRAQNKTVDQLKNEWRRQAEQNVRMELGLAQIASSENVVISDEELQAEIDKIQDKRIKAQFEAQEPRLHLRHALRQTKTLNILKNLVGS
ncbi:hypothetical protein HYS91_04000 [Candidatus Daviesbacteria bacterium]|nr:hypothetical protein [Candidatus Daviesbacteria bacterium]